MISSKEFTCAVWLVDGLGERLAAAVDSAAAVNGAWVEAKIGADSVFRNGGVAETGNSFPSEW